MKFHLTAALLVTGVFACSDKADPTATTADTATPVDVQASDITTSDTAGTAPSVCTVQGDCTGQIGCEGCVCLGGHCSPPPQGPCTETPCEGVVGRNACATALGTFCDGCATASGCIPETACVAFNTPCAVTEITPVIAPDVTDPLDRADCDPLVPCGASSSDVVSPSGGAACVEGATIVVAEGLAVTPLTTLHLSLTDASGATPDYTKILWSATGPGERVFVPSATFPKPSLELLSAGTYHITAQASLGDAGDAFGSCSLFSVDVVVTAP